MTATQDPITIARFWSKVDVLGSNECWPWRGGSWARGYGKFRGARSHRLAFELVNGPIAADAVIRHLCHNRACCNPQHLASGDGFDNAADSVAVLRHAFGIRHGRAKLTAEQVIYIRTSGKRGIDLARELGVAESTISEIRSCKWRKHG